MNTEAIFNKIRELVKKIDIYYEREGKSMNNETNNKETTEGVKLAPPWVEYYHVLKTLFSEDPDVRVVFDNGEEKAVKIYVDGTDKYEGINAILPSKKTFGNITLKIIVIPANNLKNSKLDHFANAFAGNKAVASIETVEAFGQIKNFIIFENKVVQYANDDIGDYYGIRSTVYEDIAREVFEGTDTENIFFSTKIGDNVIHD